MDLPKLSKLARTNPNAAKAFLRKEAKETSKEPRKLEMKDRVFTESQLKTVVSSLVTEAVNKIPKAKDGKTPTKEELQQIILPLIPQVKDGKDGKDGKVNAEQVNQIIDRVLKQLPKAPDLTAAIVSVITNEIKPEDIPGFTDLKARVDKLADNQKWINRPMGGGYTDADVRRVIAADGGLGAQITFQEEDGSPAGTFSTIKVTNGTLTDNGDGSASLNIPPPSGGEANTASNVGTAGVGVFKQKTAANLEFKNINAGSSAVTIADDTGNNEVDIDLSAASKASLALADSASQPGHTHVAADVTDFDTEVSNNSDVAANTAARHAAVTVTDSAEIDFTLTGQNITASIIAGSIDETKLDASTNASLDLADSAVQSVVAGTNVTVDNTDPQNPIISATGGGGGGLTWNEVTGTTQAAAVDNGYITNNASLVTVTLPATASVGETVRVAGKGAGGWRIAQNASQVIHFLSQDTTTGTGGRLDSNTRYDAVELVCITANTDWVVASSMGNITIT